jgi:hypothetical protein
VFGLVHLSAIALAFMFYGDQEFATPELAKSNLIATSSNPDGFLATITESQPKAVITTVEAPTPRKGSIPTFLSIIARKKRVHNGDAVHDFAEKVVAPVAYGYSQIFEYRVLDQKGKPFRRAGMKAHEDVLFVSGNVGVDHDLPGGTVAIDDEGRFADLQALFTETYPPLPAGSFLKFKQIVTVNYKNEDYLLGVVCIEQRVDEVVLTAFSRTDVSCK